MKSGIYQIRNIINGKIYIGSTCSTVGFYLRWHLHKSELNKNKHGNIHLQRAWNKYGEDNFEFTILESCSDKALMAKEQFWMNYYKSMDKNFGYNIRFANGRMTEETRKKLRHPKTKEHAKNISLARKGMIFTNEHRKNIAKSHKGNINVIIAKRKPINQYSLSGIFIKSFNSAKEASKELSLSKNSKVNIGRACRNERPTAYGYKWAFINS